VGDGARLVVTSSAADGRHAALGETNWLSAAVLSAAAAVAGVAAPFVIRWLDRHRPVRTVGKAREVQQRTIMLQRVRYKWIAGVLEPSLARAALLVLGLVRRPDILDLGKRAVRRLGYSFEPRPKGARISDVFDEVGGSLLIVGAPGAGKTTALLQLCDELLCRAERDPSLPIPVVFNLASWARERPPLDVWLVDELSRSYQVPLRVASEWVEQDALALLLDGLDEVASADRTACAEAVNTWRHEHGLVTLVVCSRTAELEALDTRLRLEEAVELQPPSDAEVDRYLAYLEATGTPLATVRAVFVNDPELHGLLRSPLLLHVVALAYHGRPALALYTSGTLEQRQARLWEAYVVRMFEQRPLDPACGYTEEQAIDWLAWLARTLRDRDETEFHLDRLTPFWFPPSALQERILLSICLVGGLVCGMVGGLTFALLKRAYVMDFGLATGLATGSVTGLACGLLGGIVLGLGGLITIRIKPDERANWSWWKLWTKTILALCNQRSMSNLRIRALTSNASYGTTFGLTAALAAGLTGGGIGGTSLGLFAALTAGLGCGLAWGLAGALAGAQQVVFRPTEQIRWSWSKLRIGLFAALTGGLIGGLVFGSVAGVVGGHSAAQAVVPGCGLTLILIGALIAGLSSGLRDERAVPNEGIRRSAQYAVIVGLSLGLSAGLIFGLSAGLIFGFPSGLSAGVSCGLSFGVGSGLMFGGDACLQHYVVRGWLVREGDAPWHYGPFLEAMSQRILLRRSGGAFLFIHRLLRDYLADASRRPPRHSRKSLPAADGRD
jgi:DNA polymerase III delta prime subunit